MRQLPLLPSQFTSNHAPLSNLPPQNHNPDPPLLPPFTPFATSPILVLHLRGGPQRDQPS